MSYRRLLHRSCLLSSRSAPPPPPLCLSPPRVAMLLALAHARIYHGHDFSHIMHSQVQKCSHLSKIMDYKAWISLSAYQKSHRTRRSATLSSLLTRETDPETLRTLYHMICTSCMVFGVAYVPVCTSQLCCTCGMANNILIIVHVYDGEPYSALLECCSYMYAMHSLN